MIRHNECPERKSQSSVLRAVEIIVFFVIKAESYK